MIILAIETSCDDTCVAILKIKGNRFKILSNIVSSQVKLHKKYGGVFPSLAKREHQKNLPLVLKRALKEAKPKHIKNYVLGKNPKIDLIAVTSGPGLEPCLWVGVNFAKELARSLNLPIVPVNHIEAHLYANWLQPIGVKSEIPNSTTSLATGQANYNFCEAKSILSSAYYNFCEAKSILSSAYYKFRGSKFKNLFPAIYLVVSGGHTQLILMKDFGIYEILGETRDDAAGECFDKTARILGLGYPGGPIISTLAKKYREKYRGATPVFLPRPMIYQKNYDFSFSGLKTAVLYNFQSRLPAVRKSKEYIGIMSQEIQQAIIDVLLRKSFKAAKEFKARTIILGGGVTANEELRKQFKVYSLKSKVNLLVPPKIFCTDNAAMIAAAAYYYWSKRKTKLRKKIEANANLRLN